MLSASGYLWVKSFHTIAVISWMAGILYLPRLFVYHCKAEAGSASSETFKVMERRLYRAIMTPAMVVSWGLGLWIAISFDMFSQPWFHAKLALVVAMTVSHFYLGRCRIAFAEDRNTKPEKFYRVFNEIPTLLMIGVVILVIVKPF
jgi:putative membrane protein